MEKENRIVSVQLSSSIREPSIETLNQKLLILAIFAFENHNL